MPSQSESPGNSLSQLAQNIFSGENNSNIMLAAIVSLFLVLIFVLLLHMYAKWFLSQEQLLSHARLWQSPTTISGVTGPSHFHSFNIESSPTCTKGLDSVEVSAIPLFFPTLRDLVCRAHRLALVVPGGGVVVVILHQQMDLRGCAIGVVTENRLGGEVGLSQAEPVGAARHIHEEKNGARRHHVASGSHRDRRGLLPCQAQVPQRLYTKLRNRPLNPRMVQAKRHFIQGAQILAQARRSNSPTLAKQALAEAEKAIDLDPKDAASHLLKSMALNLQGFRSYAFDALDAALSPLVAASLAAEERGDAQLKCAKLKISLNQRKRIDSAVAVLKTETVEPLQMRRRLPSLENAGEEET
ncbi:hypothetical protein Fmac_008099 [Flemingia macrophylla]|uniref:Uncharacterized protein n=1 Tax=Flemingia macrophylla TaxID=520843 RepID=A0ABD1MWF7_9FABA